MLHRYADMKREDARQIALGLFWFIKSLYLTYWSFSQPLSKSVSNCVRLSSKRVAFEFLRALTRLNSSPSSLDNCRLSEFCWRLMVLMI